MPSKSPRSRRAVAWLLALAMVAGGSWALHAFVLTGVEWPGTFATFRVNPNFPAGAPGTDAEQIAAIRCGADAWRDQALLNFQFIYQGTTGISFVNEFDGTNACFWTAGPAGGSTLAITFYAFDGFDNFIGYDIAYYGSNSDGSITWNGAGDPVGNQIDLGSVSAHEFGHALGMDHSPITGATMEAFYNGVQGRTLHVDDEAGAASIYGTIGSLDDDPQIDDVDPPSGPAAGGNTVTITGQNFTWDANTILRVDGQIVSAALVNVVNSATIIVSSMPARPPGPVEIQVNNELGQVVLADAYVYESPAPVISGIFPPSGSTGGGTSVTINGSNFDSTSAVAFIGASPLQNATVSPTTITGETPPGALGSVDVIVIQGSESDILANGFTYTADELRIADASAGPGSVGAPVSVFASHTIPLEGFSFGCAFDSTFVADVELTEAGTASDGAAFFAPNVQANFFTLGVVMDLSGPGTIPAGTDQVVALALFDIEAFAPLGEIIVLEIRDDLGVPPVPVSFVIPGGTEIVPGTVDGSITVGAGTFIRGDVDADGVFNGLVDGLYLLNFGFANGSPPPCDDAADADDDGVLNALVDSIYILTHQFNNGPPPPPPYPGAGTDPTPDSLGC